MNAPAELANIEPRRGVSMTEYRISGTLDSVLAGVRTIFETYPAAGYGTRVHSIEETAMEVYAARMSRANSCD